MQKINSDALPESFLRLNQIIGQSAVTEKEAAENRRKGKSPKRPRKAIAPVIPVRKSTWWDWVKRGRAPKPIELYGVTVWRRSDIARLIEQAGK